METTSISDISTWDSPSPGWGRGVGRCSPGGGNQAQGNHWIKVVNGNVWMIKLTSSFREYTLSSHLHDNGWHHLCLTWGNTDGMACLYLDGSTLICTPDYQTGQTIAENGTFVLGQEQDSVGTVSDGFICH